VKILCLGKGNAGALLSTGGTRIVRLSLAAGHQQLWYAEDVDHTLEVVCRAREAESSANELHPLREEMALIIGVFDRARGVFHELLALLHDLRVGFELLLCEPLWSLAGYVVKLDQ
jgi:hypothetical protein